MTNCDRSRGLVNDPATVLVIDHAPGQADTYQSLLGQRVRVLAASYEGGILDLCQAQPIDLILLEIHAPDPRGFELLDQLKAQLGDPCPPTVVIGENDANLATRALRAGAADYLVRDQITAERLEQVLYEALDQAAAAPPGDRAVYPRPIDRDRFLAVGSDLQAIAGVDGYFHWVSPTFEQLLGWTPAELTSRPWVEFVHPDDAQPSLTEAQHLLAGTEVLAFENRYRHRDGTYRWLRWHCQMDAQQQVSYGTAVDISAFKQSETALSKSHVALAQQTHWCDTMLSAISDFVYLFDRQGRFAFANQPLLDLWGLSLDQVVGKRLAELDCPEALAEKLQQQIEQVFTTAQTVRDETPYTTATGIGGIYEYILMPLLGPDGSVQSVVGSTRNVTEHRHVAATLQESEERLRLIADTVPQIIWITDARGRVEFVNQQWKDYTGALKEPLNALEAIVSFVHPDDVALTMEAFDQALRTRTSFRAEHRIQSAVGTYRWFLVQAEPYHDTQTGEISRWFGTLVDVHDLKIVEAALRTSEAKYRSLFNSMDEGFCILEVIFDQGDRPIDCRYLETNPVFEQKSGLKNALGKTIRQLVPNIEPFWFDIYGRVALTGDPMRFEDHSQSMGRWFDVNAFRIGEPYERKVAVLFSDITRRKQTEARLHHAAKLDAFRVTLSDALRVLSDPLAVQATACRLLGQELNAGRVYYYEYNEETAAGVVHNAYAQGGESSIVGAYSFDDFPSIHTRLRLGYTLLFADIANALELPAAERSRFSTMGFGALVCVPLVKHQKLVASFNVSQALPRPWTPLEIALMQETAERTWAAVERAQAEATVAANLNDMQLLRDLSVRLTAEDSTQVLCDQILTAAIALMGAAGGSLQTFDQTRQELVLLAAQGFDPAIVEDFGRVDARSTTPCGQTLAKGTRCLVDFDVPPSDDPSGALQRLVEAGYRSGQATPLISRTGQFIGMVSTHWRSRHRPTQRELRFLDLLVRQAADLLEQRRIEAERQRLLEREQAAREDAERANRAKDEFLAILSHELRSPLNPILGWAKLLQMRTFDAEKTQQALATIERNAQLQTQLIDDLLDVAKILRGKLELKDAAIDLATVIEAAMEVVRTSVQAKSIAVQMSLAEGCLVTGDDARLQQVIWNLLSNAVKFTPQRGQIEIWLEPVNDCAQVTITDSGKGISAEFLPQLFDSFRQEDVSITRQYGGLGLGLSIVKYLVEAHGGSIAATSPGLGQGATFTLRLPLVQPTAIPPLAAPLPPPDIDLSGVKVLTVDDSEDTRDLVAALLERYGAEVRVATSGQEVLSYLASFEPDVLVCDICMPTMDGYTLLQEIRRLPPEQGGELPAIAVTAYARDDDQQQALNHGFQHHIPKPIEPETLLGAVAGLTKHRPRGCRNNSPDTFQKTGGAKDTTG